MLCGVPLRGCKPSTHLPHGVILPAELVWIFGSGEGLFSDPSKSWCFYFAPRVRGLSRATSPPYSITAWWMRDVTPGRHTRSHPIQLPCAGPVPSSPGRFGKRLFHSVSDLFVKFLRAAAGNPSPWTVWRKRSSIPTPGPLVYVYSRFLGGLARQRGQTNPFLQWKYLSEQYKPY
jgi:hypothetical protein